MKPARYRSISLPEEVKATFLDFDWEKSEVIAPDIVVFYAFNYGSARALSFAAGLPLTALRRANEMSGWRPKSHSLLRAIIHYREQLTMSRRPEEVIPQPVANLGRLTEYTKDGFLGLVNCLRVPTRTRLRPMQA